MKTIIIDLDLLKKIDLNINEYLILYDIANNYSISSIFNYNTTDLLSLQEKAFIKLTENDIYLRAKANSIFSVNEDLFKEWLELYPTNVKKKDGGTRALSPSTVDTILGNKLKTKWNTIFKKDRDKQLFAIKVLRAEIESKRKSGDLEYMVEAYRWLNEGFHEKFSYLVESNEKEEDNKRYESEDWI